MITIIYRDSQTVSAEWENELKTNKSRNEFCERHQFIIFKRSWGRDKSHSTLYTFVLQFTFGWDSERFNWAPRDEKIK